MTKLIEKRFISKTLLNYFKLKTINKKAKEKFVTKLSILLLNKEYIPPFQSSFYSREMTISNFQCNLLTFHDPPPY